MFIKVDITLSEVVDTFFVKKIVCIIIQKTLTVKIGIIFFFFSKFVILHPLL